ncbi:alpha/beta fold hydrolase, partial [Streptomyces sp. YIM 98790]|uniref:alpha/beta hydrolase n=1 Tax=Streptomyces sp. YIM 98790 TaxID=2689077 RepID=UPI001A9FA628
MVSLLAAAPPVLAAAAAGGDSAARRGAEAAAERAAAAGVDWGPCPPGENLPEPVECGTVTVPLDYADPDGETIGLHLSRLPASGPAGERQGALVYNPGGPGGNGMVFPLYPRYVSDPLWRDLNRVYDFVGFAPRGVAPSAPLSCQDPEEFTRGPNPAPVVPSFEYKLEMNRKAAAYAAGCHDSQGDRLAHFSTPAAARDLHVIRAALGERRLTYLGVSYGTYLGSVYATLFPGSVRRMVLDSVVNPDPSLIWYRSNLLQSRAFEFRWQDWKEWVAGHHEAYGLGESAAEVQRVFDDAREALAREPLGGTVGPKELHSTFLAVAYTERLWPALAEVLAAYREGDSEPLHRRARPATGPAAADAENGNAVYTAVECNDAPWPREWGRWDADHTAMAFIAPFETWENGWLNLPCAYWPLPYGAPVDVGVRPGELAPVLLLQSTEDAATPYAGAVETRRRLPGSALVVEEGSGEHGVAGGNDCVDALLTGYLVHGRTPAEHTACPARPAPEPQPEPEPEPEPEAEPAEAGRAAG